MRSIHPLTLIALFALSFFICTPRGSLGAGDEICGNSLDWTSTKTKNLNHSIPFFGVQLHTVQWEPARHRRAVDLMVEAGIQVGRDECHWSHVEQKKGELVIPPDFITNLNYTYNRGREILLLLNYSNALYDNGKPPTSPEGVAAYARYCRTMVEATKGKIKYFEVWNEPNAEGFWPPRPDPRAYARLLKAASAAIREANPEAVILAPATSGYAEDFLREMLKEPGVWESFDVLSFHPYCHPASPEAAQKFEQLDALMEELKAHGAPKPVWLTEFGYHTADMGGVTEREQAAYLARFYLLAMTRPYISGVVWYWLGPDGPNPDWGEDRFGLVREDYSKKPSYISYRSITSNLSYGNGIKYVTDLSSSDYYCFEFERTSPPSSLVARPILCAWSKHEPVIMEIIVSADQVLMVNIMDNIFPSAMRPPTENQSVYITLNETPILIQSKDKIKIPEQISDTPTVFIPQHDKRTVPGFGQIIPVILNNSNAEYKLDARLPLDSPFMAEANSNNSVELYCKADSKTGAYPIEFHFLNPKGINEIHGIQTSFFLYRTDLITTQPVIFEIKPIFNNQNKKKLVEVSLINNMSFEFNPFTGHFIKNNLIESLDKPGYGQLRPGQSTKRYLDMARFESDLTDTIYNIKSMVSIHPFWKSEFDDLVSFQTAIYSESKIKIDGDLSDWPAAGDPIRIGERWQVTGEFRPWRGSKDSNARVWVAWNDEWFYFAAEFEDDKFCAEFDDWQVYRNDGFELYFDIDHDGDRAVKSYNEDDFQWGVFPTKSGPVVWRWPHYNSASPGAKFVFNRTPRREQTISGTEFTGYIYEAALPMSELRWTPRHGQHIGFNVAFTDADDPEFVHPFGQEVQLSWSGRPNNHLTPHSFADLFLAGPAEKKSE